MHIELGDIIKLNSPELEQYNSKIFLVFYIDNELLKIKNVKTKEEFLFIIDDGNINEPLIESIELLKRHDKNGFVKQNNLDIDSWIDIQFEIELPFFIVGKITNIDEDMIEITVYDTEVNELSDDVIFIDFAYKGIPIDSNIKEITLREKPGTIVDTISNDDLKDDYTVSIITEITDIDKILEQAETLDSIDVKQVKRIENRQYGLQNQLLDIVDDMLSIYETPTRNQLNSINMIITRYKELYLKHVNNDKPIRFIDNIINYNWVLPIVVNKQKFYDIEDNEEYYLSSLNSESIVDLIRENKILYTNSSIENRYSSLLNDLIKNYSISDSISHTSNILTLKNNNSICVVYDNDTESYNKIESYYVSVDSNGISYIKTTGDLEMSSVFINTANIIKDTDYIHVKSFLILPLSVILKRSIKYNGLNILHSSILNSFNNLSQFTYKKKKILDTSITSDMSSKDKKDLNEFYNNNLLNKYLNIQNNISIDDTFETYKNNLNLSLENFLNYALSNLLDNKLSIYEVLKLLKIFNIDAEFINSTHFDIINTVLQEKITKFKEYIITLKTSYLKKIEKVSESNFYKLFNEHMKTYSDNLSIYTTSEIINLLLEYDVMNSFSYSLLSTNVNILDIKKFNNASMDYIDNTGLNLNLKKCSKYYLSKIYDSLEKLSLDNGVETIFDSDLDPTNYDLLDKKILENEKASIDLLIEKYKFTKEDAIDEYNSIRTRKRLVKPGHYALLKNNSVMNIFERSSKNIWELTNKFTGISTSNLFCNFQSDCFKLKIGPCSSVNEKLKENKVKVLGDSLNEFNNDIIESKEKYKQIMINNFINYNNILSRIILHNNDRLLYYNNKLYDISITYIPDDYEMSPFYDIFQNILSLQDLQLKYEILIKFCNKYTRAPNLSLKTNIESEYWRYCLKTNIKLVPIFLFNLAVSYVSNTNYKTTLISICKTQGTISEDGDKIVDIHSGYKIKDLEYNDEAYFTAPIEESLNPTIQYKIDISKISKLTKVQNKYVFNIIESICKQIYISFPIEIKESILKNVYEDFKMIDINPDKKFSEKELELLETYFISYLTVAYIILEIACSIPSYKSKKQYPGCIKSFNGWPVDDKSNNMLVEYIGCVIYNIRTKSSPWKIFMNKSLHGGKPISQDVIADKITFFIESYLLEKSEILAKINLKVKDNYKTNTEIQEEHKIQNWYSFLPPQQKLSINFKITQQYSNLTSTELLNKIMYNSIILFNTIQNYLEDKMVSIKDITLDPTLYKVSEYKNIYDSLLDKELYSILENIDKINKIYLNFIHKKNSNTISYSKNYNIHNIELLRNSANDITLQNRLIYSKIFDKNYYDYLIKLIPTLPPVNDLKSIDLILLDDTFKKYNIVLNSKNFLSFYNFINITNNVQILYYDYIHENIFLKNILDANLDKLDLSNKLDDDFNLINEELLKIINKTISNESPEKNSINYLSDLIYDKITEYKSVISTYLLNYVKRYKLSDKRKTINFITTFFESYLDFFNFWTPIRKSDIKLNYYSTIEDESIMRAIQYCKNILYILVNLMQNILLNSISYKDIDIPKHWDLSSIHNDDIKNFIKKYFSFTKNYDECGDIFKTLFTDLNIHSNIITSICDKLNCNDIEKINNPKFQYLYLQYLLIYFIIKLIPKDDDLVDNDINICISTVIHDFFNLIGLDNLFKHVNVSYDSINNIVNRVKDKEKKKITDMLKDMSKEQRRVDDEFKRYGIGFWSKGKEKGLREHQNDKYDNDRLDEMDDKDDFMQSLHGDIFYTSSDIDDIEAIDMNNIGDDDEIIDDN